MRASVERRLLPTYVTRSDVQRILDACQTERDRLLIELLWYTGARISEVLQARVGDLTDRGIRLVNLKQGKWVQTEDGRRVHQRILKEKHVRLPPAFLARLREHVRGRRGDEPIITDLTGKRGIDRRRAWQIVKKAALDAGVYRRRLGSGSLRPVWPHTFRHGYAVNLLVQGIPITVVKDQLGHASLNATQIYTEIADPHKEALISGVQF